MKIILGLFLCLLFCGLGFGQSDGQKDSQSKDRPLKIIKIPHPNKKAVQACYEQNGLQQLKVVIRVTFDKTAVITAAEIISPSDCKEFDEESVKNCYKIRFSPEVKDGEAITVTKQIQSVSGI